MDESGCDQDASSEVLTEKDDGTGASTFERLTGEEGKATCY